MSFLITRFDRKGPAKRTTRQDIQGRMASNNKKMLFNFLLSTFSFLSSSLQVHSFDELAEYVFLFITIKSWWTNEIFLSSTFSSPPLRRQKPNIAYFCLGNWLLDLSYFLCFCKSKLIAQMFFTINNEKRIFLFACFFMLSSFLLPLLRSFLVNVI